MYIECKEYHLILDESEMWIFIYALIDKFKNSIPHCVEHNGINTLKLKYQKELDIMQNLCNRIGRSEIFYQELESIEKEIQKRIKENK